MLHNYYYINSFHLIFMNRIIFINLRSAYIILICQEHLHFSFLNYFIIVINVYLKFINLFKVSNKVKQLCHNLNKVIKIH
mmetsp:Transcript_9813/g.867  ORF Transcript_9813/g.867 Transcript_9813/m.867 type:complete len:80 (+) Transcript_9813:105-344(+)